MSLSRLWRKHHFQSPPPLSPRLAAESRMMRQRWKAPKPTKKPQRIAIFSGLIEDTDHVFLSTISSFDKRPFRVSVSNKGPKRLHGGFCLLIIWVFFFGGGEWKAVHFGSVQDGVYAYGQTHMRSTKSVWGFQSVVLESVRMLVWLTIESRF